MKKLGISILLCISHCLPLACEVPTVTYFSVNNNRPGSDLQIHCSAIGTPAPNLSVVDDKGTTVCVSDVPGTLDYTIYNGGCSGSLTYYTCWADNLEKSSIKILYDGSCPKDSSYLSPFASFCVANGTIFALIILFILGCYCKRKISRSSRRPPENAVQMSPNVRSQATEATQQRSGLSRPIALVGTIPNLTHPSLSYDALFSESRARPQRLTRNWKFPNGPFLRSMPAGNRGSISRINASSTSMHTDDTTLEQRASQTSNRSVPRESCVHTTVMSPPYDVTFTPHTEYTQIPAQRVTTAPHDDRPPEYNEVLTQRETPVVYDDRPPEYTQIPASRATPALRDYRPPEYTQIPEPRATPALSDDRPPEYTQIMTQQETPVMYDDRPPEYNQISTGQAALVVHDDRPPEYTP